MAITKETCEEFSKLMKEALETIGDYTGIKLSLGTIRYSSDSLSVTITGAACGEDGTSADKLMWDKYAEIIGLKKEDFGKIIEIGGKEFKIAGCNPRAKKNKVLLELDGRIFSAPVAAVKSSLKKNKEE